MIGIPRRRRRSLTPVRLNDPQNPLHGTMKRGDLFPTLTDRWTYLTREEKKTRPMRDT
jgi:hypothetical protein